MSKLNRSISFIIAMMFLLSSFALTGFVVWTMIQQNNEDKSATEENILSQNASKVTELQTTDTVVGEGEEVKAGDTVTVHYVGTLVSDGSTFDSSKDRGEPATFSLDQVIVGWQEGIPGMKVGGKRTLVVPADKAYGAQALPGIPANSDLQFEVELISIGAKTE